LFKVALNTITITYFRSGAAIIVELGEWNESINLAIYQVHVGKTQYTMQILKGKYLVNYSDYKRINNNQTQWHCRKIRPEHSQPALRSLKNLTYSENSMSLKRKWINDIFLQAMLIYVLDN
jgi:hypothetical protein